MRIPKLSYREDSNRFFVKIGGKFHYLGKDPNKAQIAYCQLIAQNYNLADVPDSLRPSMDVRIDELVIEYLETVRQRYERTRSFNNFQQAGKLLIENFGGRLAREFNRHSFELLKKIMAGQQMAMRTANVRIDIIKRIFRYAEENEIITAEHYFRIKAVNKFRRADEILPPPEEVEPVSDEVVRKTLPFLTSVVADMVILQQRTGMRSGELCPLRFCDIDMTPNEFDVWAYRPKHHKTASKGKKRAIFFNRTCQEILRRYITDENRNSEDYVFSPAQSMEIHRSEQRRKRKSRVQPSQSDRSKPSPQRRPRLKYSSDTYARAILRGCKAAVLAGVLKESEIWHSHQLRHWAGTEARRVKGLDAAQALLGHAHASTTEIYAVTSEALAAQTAALIG